MEARHLKDLLVSSGIREGAKQGPRVHMTQDKSDPKKWYVSAVDLRRSDVRRVKGGLLKYSKTCTCSHLSVQTEDDMFDLLEVPEKYLEGFVKDPREMIFPPVATLPDGIKKCLQNALRLCDSVDALLASGQDLGHASFLLLTSLEELGKACMILQMGKEAKKKESDIAVVRQFRDHSEKLWRAGIQLKEIAVETQPHTFLDLEEILLTVWQSDESARFMGIERGSLASIHREYGLYVNYFSHSKTWGAFKDRFDQFTAIFTHDGIKSTIELVRKACCRFLNDVETKQLDAREPKDLFKRIQIDREDRDIEENQS